MFFYCPYASIAIPIASAHCKAEFRWDQRMNPFSRRKHEARAAYDKEQTLSLRGVQLQFEMRSALQRIGYLSQQLESRLLPLLVMRLGQAELLQGTSLGVVRAAVGNYENPIATNMANPMHKCIPNHHITCVCLCIS